jgi:hypothetical protein
MSVYDVSADQMSTEKSGRVDRFVKSRRGQITRMRSARARYAATLVATAAATVGCVLGSAGAVHAASTPSWEPDPNAVAGIAFFNAAGTQITSGSATASPMAAFAVATNAVRAGDTKALLYAALPDPGTNTLTWSVDQLSSATTFPVTGAPGGTPNPTVAGAATDESLATFATDFPSSTGIYQLRIRTESASSNGQSTQYAAADVVVSGGTWTEVYPKNASGPTAPSKFKNLAKPVLSGKHKVGAVEKSSHGSWEPGATSYSYQWFKGSAKIKGATKASLKLTKAFKGKLIHCTVTVHKSGYSNASASSKNVKVTS